MSVILIARIGYGRTLERLHHRNPGGSSRSRRVLDRESNGWMAGYRKLTATRNLKSLIPPESQASLTLCESGVGVCIVLRDRRDAKFPRSLLWEIEHSDPV